MQLCFRSNVLVKNDLAASEATSHYWRSYLKLSLRTDGEDQRLRSSKWLHGAIYLENKLLIC